jgi:hypothetical protein
MTTALSAAKSTGLIVHSHRCRSSGLVSCVCGYDARVQDLAAQFLAFGVAFEMEGGALLKWTQATAPATVPTMRHYQEDDL